MDKAEKIGLGVAAAGHVLLFALLSATLLAPKKDVPLPKSMDVSLVDQVALDSSAPATTEAPAASKAPEIGPIEDSSPPAPAETIPEPAPPTAQPEPAPAPKAAPVAPPQPRKPAPPAPTKAKTPAKPPAAAPKTPAKSPTKPGAGNKLAANQTRPRGGNLGDIMKGIVAEAEPKARGQTPRGATMSSQAAADIGSAISRQVQPCAARQTLSGAGANRIRVTIRLNINKDGSLAGRPQVVGFDGVDDENRRYQERVSDLTIAAFVACSPLKGLPPELYDVPRGWKQFSLRFKLPG